MSKFAKMLSQEGSSIKQQRAENVAQSVSLEMDNIIRNKERELLAKKSKLQSMMDFGNETTISLKIVKDDFSAESWSKEYLDLKVSVSLLEAELKIQKSAYDELFGVSEE